MPAEKSSRAEEIELRWKELQIQQMEEQMATRRDQQQRLEADRKRQYDDFRKGEAIIRRRQQVCKHRKGGRDNRFWDGNGANYSIIENTYPTGEQVKMCTRCGKQVWKPGRALRKTDPKLYAAMQEEWALWSSYPTDNTPSGSKIFEVFENVA